MTKKYKYQEKYQEKVGLISKAYKLDKTLVSEFKDACDKADITQAKQLSIMMQDFINKVNKEG